jgi:hypothetical protein
MSQTQPGPRRPGSNEPAQPAKPTQLPTTPDRRPDIEPDRERREPRPEPNQDLPKPEKPAAPVPTPHTA